MKMLIGLIALTMTATVVASSGETKTFVYDGSQNSVQLLLRGEKTHTEYRSENVRRTCYRTGVVGYRTICSNPIPSPGPGPYRPHHPGPRSCWREPVYGQIPYSCIQTVRIPYEVKDYDVEARVTVDVTKLAPAVNSVEAFKVKLMGDELSLEVQGSKKFLVMLKHRDVRSSGNGSIKHLDGLYAVELIEAAPILSALKMKNVSYDDGVLNFELGQVTATENLGFALNAKKQPRVRANTVLFDRELASSEVKLTSNGNTTQGEIDLKAIGVRLEGGRHGLTPKIFFKGEGSLLNGNEFEKLEASQTLILKL